MSSTSILIQIQTIHTERIWLFFFIFLENTAPSLYRMNFVIIKGNIRQNSSKLREDKSWNVPRS